jgi:hypothetical protein
MADLNRQREPSLPGERHGESVPPKTLGALVVDGRSYTVSDGKVSLPSEAGVDEYAVVSGAGSVGAEGRNVLVPPGVRELGEVAIKGRLFVASADLRVSGAVSAADIRALGNLSAGGEILALDGRIVVDGDLRSTHPKPFPIQASGDVIVGGRLDANSATSIDAFVYCDYPGRTEIYGGGLRPLSERPR